MGARPVNMDNIPDGQIVLWLEADPMPPWIFRKMF